MSHPMQPSPGRSQGQALLESSETSRLVVSETYLPEQRKRQAEAMASRSDSYCQWPHRCRRAGRGAVYRTWPAERKFKAKQPWATGRKAPPAPAAGPSRRPPDVLPGPPELPPTLLCLSSHPKPKAHLHLQNAFTRHTVRKAHSRYSIISLHEWNAFRVLSLSHLVCGTQSLDVYNRTLPTGPLPTTTQTWHSCLLCTQMPGRRRLVPSRHCLADLLCPHVFLLPPSTDSQGYPRLHSASDLFLVQPGIHNLPALVGSDSPFVWGLQGP